MFIDLIIVAVIILSALVGFARGFLPSIMSLFGWAASLIIAVWLGGRFIDLLDSFFDVREMVSEAFITRLESMNPTLFAQPPTEENIIQGLYEFGLPGFINNLLVPVLYPGDPTVDIALSHLLGPALANIVLRVLSMLILFTLLSVLTTLLNMGVNSLLLDRDGERKTLGQVDRAVGVLFGIGRGIVMVVAGFFILIIALSLPFGAEFGHNIEPSLDQSFIARHVLYNLYDQIIQMLDLENILTNVQF
ncbi:MAG: CvpA family protein [Firmicutes bacterium]|nr:CvpA family protein [Bacillota bacterium]